MKNKIKYWLFTGVYAAFFIGGIMYPFKYYARPKGWIALLYHVFTIVWIFLWPAILFAVEHTYFKDTYENLKTKASEKGKNCIEEFLSEHEFVSYILVICFIGIITWIVLKL